MPKIAVLQMNSGIDPEENLAVIHSAVKDAAEAGAQILFTPEMAALLDRDRKRANAHLSAGYYEEVLRSLASLAENHKIDIALGSLPMPVTETLNANRAYYFSRDNFDQQSPVTYDKMHMFDVKLSTGEKWRESSAYQAGEEVVTVEDTPIGRLGLAICYDMRFPALFEELGRRECDAISIPAAFTVPTGKAHWHVLLRARAIEASAFVIAAAQVGKHADGRTTFGHSLVVDPWGDVLLDMGGEAPGIGYCDIDLARIAEVRGQVPSLANRREIAN
ncbi:MAG: carbon-nitrogen hydrolase family protein [Erythrobacter sp.]